MVTQIQFASLIGGEQNSWMWLVLPFVSGMVVFWVGKKRFGDMPRFGLALDIDSKGINWSKNKILESSDHQFLCSYDLKYTKWNHENLISRS